MTCKTAGRLFAILCFSLSPFGACSLAAGQVRDPERWEVFGKACERLRDVEQRIGAAGPEQRRQVAADCLQGWSADRREHPTAYGAAFRTYYGGRLMLAAGDRDGAALAFRAAATSPATAPEALFGLFELSCRPDKPIARETYALLLGRVLPASVWAVDLNRRDCGPSFGLGTGGAPVPAPDPEMLPRVAEWFESMGMSREATDAYREAAYASLAPPSVGDASRPARTWLSAAAAPLWLRAAQAAWATGEVDLAANCLAKTLVYADRFVHKDALGVLNDWRASGAPGAAPEPRLDPDKVRAIAKAYARMNLHPRSIALLRRAAPVLGDAAGRLEAEYAASWSRWVQAFAAGHERIVVWGQAAGTEEQRRVVVVPRPCSPEVMRQVRAVLGEDGPVAGGAGEKVKRDGTR